jgi:transposase
MKPYSKDLRIRVLAVVDCGVPREEVARTFSVSVPTIKRWLKRRRETGDVDAKPIPGRPRVKGVALEGWLPSLLQKNHDLTLEEHREAFEEAHGSMAVSAATLGRAIARLPGSWPLKKVSRSLRARRGGQVSVEVTGESLRGPATGVHRGVRVPYLDGTPQGSGSERGAGVRQGTEKPRQKPNAHRLHEPPRRDGRGHLHRGRDRRRAL